MFWFMDVMGIGGLEGVLKDIQSFNKMNCLSLKQRKKRKGL